MAIGKLGHTPLTDDAVGETVRTATNAHSIPIDVNLLLAVLTTMHERFQRRRWHAAIHFDYSDPR